jgi:hypothetical protein
VREIQFDMLMCFIIEKRTSFPLERCLNVKLFDAGMNFTYLFRRWEEDATGLEV